MPRNASRWRWCRMRPCQWKPGWTVDYVDVAGKRRQRYAGLTPEIALAYLDGLVEKGHVRRYVSTRNLVDPYYTLRENMDAVNAAVHSQPREEYALYFLEAEGTGRMKIGITGTSLLPSRLRTLECHSPIPLMCHGYVVSPTRRIEAEVHRRFRAFRLHGEWFTFSPEIKEYIRQNAVQPPPGGARNRTG